MKIRTLQLSVSVFLRKLAILSTVCLAMSSASAIEKPRVFVLTDIENEPDDAMSMVRFLVYANQYDVEGLAEKKNI